MMYDSRDDKTVLCPFSNTMYTCNLIFTSNGQMDGSYFPGLIANPKVYQSWAYYFSKFISSYAEYGINFWGLTIQNEPENAADYEACCYNPEQERDFLVNYLGPQLKQDHPNVNIMIYDHNKDRILHIT